MVAHRIIWPVSEHGYEMRCPDAGTGHQSGSQNPEQASPGNILARAGEQMKGEKLANMQRKPASATSRKSCSTVRHS